MRVPISSINFENFISSNIQETSNNEDEESNQNSNQLREYIVESYKPPVKRDTRENNSKVVGNSSTSSNSDNMDTFLKWRNHSINSKPEICQFLENSDFPNKNVIKHQIKILPKCMVHLTKKICKCDPKCVAETFDDFKFDQNCSLFDLENVFTDDKYIKECKNYDYRPINGKMVEYKVGKNVNKAKENFYKNLDELCDDHTKIYETKFSAYELRDECFNDMTCLVDALNQDVTLDCKNDDFEKQVNEISKIFDLKFNARFRKDLSNNQNSQSFGRRLRSLDEISTASPIPSLENSTAFKDLNINTSATIAVSGIILISLLGYLSVKNKRNNLKFRCYLSTAFLVTIALLVYFLSSGIIN